MIHTRRLTLALGFTETLAWATTYYIPATMAGAAADELGASRTMLLGGFSLSLLVCGVCSPWVGRRIDRIGGRGVLASSTVVTAAGLGLMALSPNVAVWYAAWMIIGVGMAMGLYDAAFGTLGRLLGHDARPAIVGVTLMAGFASTVGWPLGTWLVAHVGWRGSVACYAAMQLAVMLPILLIFVPRASPNPVAPVVQAPVGRLPVDRVFVWMMVFFMLRQAISSVISVHALVLLDKAGFSPLVAVAAVTLIGPGQVGSRIIDWFFGRKLNPMVAAWVGSALLPLAMLALLGGASAYVFTLLYGLSNGILTISRGTLPLHVFGPAGYAARVGRLAMPSMIASAIAPTLVAPLMTQWSAGAVSGLLGVLGVVALGCLFGLQTKPR